VSDLLYRGRGAEVGVRAPAWRIRLAGALLGLFLMELLGSLGVLSLLGVGGHITRAVFLLGGALLATSAWGAWLWTATASLVLVHGVVAYTPLASRLFDQFVRRDAPVAGDPPDAVVVFSGTVTPEGRVMGQAMERLLSGLSEARRRTIPTLALSVVGDERDTSVPNSERDQRELVSAFAPELQLKFVYNVRSSRDEALAFSALARTYRWRRVLAITSASHTRRACAALEHEGPVVECLPAISRSYAPSRLESAGDRRAAFREVLYETAATLLYRGRGWM
jgi:uncharacterized SAM-binding protein YcdF (DUF218 family)